MKVNLQKLDKSVLADFFESQEYKSLRIIMAQMQEEWKRQAVDAPTIEALRELRGKINALTEFDDQMKKNHKTNLPNIL
jgi:hypothetical protein